MPWVRDWIWSTWGTRGWYGPQFVRSIAQILLALVKLRHAEHLPIKLSLMLLRPKRQPQDVAQRYSRTDQLWST